MESNWRWNDWRLGHPVGPPALVARFLNTSTEAYLGGRHIAPGVWENFTIVGPILNYGWLGYFYQYEATPFPFGYDVEPDH